jgi:hypothetical protein
LCEVHHWLHREKLPKNKTADAINPSAVFANHGVNAGSVYPSNGGQTVHGIELSRHGLLIVEVPLHLPVSEIKSTMGAAAHANSICLTLVRKRPAQLGMPATKDPRHPISDSLAQ